MNKKKEMEMLQLAELTHQASCVTGNVVEIGSLYGRSAIAIAKGLKQNGKGKIFTIDPHQNYYSKYDTFLKNVNDSGLKEYIHPVKDFSFNVLLKQYPVELFQEPLKMLFIDGDHSYEGMKKDLKWIPWIQKGGRVLFHDYCARLGVTKAVDEYCANHSDLKLLKTVGSLIIFEKL